MPRRLAARRSASNTNEGDTWLVVTEIVFTGTPLRIPGSETIAYFRTELVAGKVEESGIRFVAAALNERSDAASLQDGEVDSRIKGCVLVLPSGDEHQVCCYIRRFAFIDPTREMDFAQDALGEIQAHARVFRRLVGKKGGRNTLVCSDGERRSGKRRVLKRDRVHLILQVVGFVVFNSPGFRTKSTVHRYL